MIRSASVFVVIVACIAGWSNSAAAQPAPAPQIILTPPPAYTPPPTPAPESTQSGAPAPPVPAPSPIPSPAGTPSPYHFVYTPAPVPGAGDPPADAPSILEIDLTDKILHAPGPLNIRVVTGAMVAKVTMHVLGRNLELPKTGDGLFSVDNQLPSVPFWLHGKTYQVDFVAAVPDGRSVTVTIPVTLR